MKKLILVMFLLSSPAWLQTRLAPKAAAARADNCAPIGRTADGKLVYSMKCETLPAQPAPPPQAVAMTIATGVDMLPGQTLGSDAQKSGRVERGRTEISRRA